MDTDGKDVVFEQRIFIGAGDAGAQDGHHGYEHHPGLPIAEGELRADGDWMIFEGLISGLIAWCYQGRKVIAFYITSLSRHGQKHHNSSIGLY